MFRYSYLYDREFLKLITEQPTRIQHIKLNVFTYNDQPLGEIQGVAIGGTININGKSNIRRQGNLQMVASDEIYNITNVENLISLNKKVEVYIGIENMTTFYTEDKIIWFPLGAYVITQASITHSTNNISIQISIKDEMARLNGECGGTFTIPITHSPIDVLDANNEPTKQPVKFYDLIFALVNQWGGIPSHKIIIEDVPLRIKQSVQWRGNGEAYSYTLGTNANAFIFTTVKPKSEVSGLVEYQFADNIGYWYTDFTVPRDKELSSNAGDSIVSVLDKIAKMLGNFEFFFDVNGVFHFQEIKNFLNEGSPIDDLNTAINEKYLVNYEGENSVYSFIDGKVNISYQNSPQYSNIKNDIVVWGKRNSQPIHYHLLIDFIPSVDIDKEYIVVFYKNDPNSTSEKEKIRKPRSGETGDPITATDWRTQILLEWVCNEVWHPLAQELEAEWHKVYDIKNGQFYPVVKKEEDSNAIQISRIADLPYYVDMIDPRDVPSLAPFSISKIGRRERSYKQDDINCLFTPQYPNYIYLEAGSKNIGAQREEAIKNGDKWTQISSFANNALSSNAAFNSAYDYIRSVLHKITSYNENISLNAIPVYHLEPNTRITVKDDKSCIYGDYIINSMSIPLAPSGQMTIQASKAIERI